MTGSVETKGGCRKIAIFTANMDGGGAERAMAKLAGGIAERGYDVDLVLSRAVGHYLEEVPATVRIVDLGASRVLASLPRFVAYLRRERPPGVITSMNYVNIVGVWARRLSGIKTVLVANEQNTLSFETRNSPRRRHRAVESLAGRFYPWADAVAAVSQGVADDLVREIHVPADVVHVAFNPIITPALRTMAAEPLDHPWFKDDEPPVVVAVGRLAQQKDFGNLIRAFATVRASRNARLMIIGDGPERGALEATVTEAGVGRDVSLPGWISNPYPYMVRAGAYVLSSRWEGLPSVLVEALYCGPPTIATDCPSGPMEILAGGKHGALVPVGDTPALAEAIDRALAGDVPRPSSESWQPYVQDAVVDRYLHLLGERP
jgi:glycosyltransferase involved in cell wall biosynthesis